jgi:hypothetical protein
LVAVLNALGTRKLDVAKPLLRLASIFAGRTGGMTADLWSTLPSSLEGLSADDSIRLAERAAEFIDFGGSVTLHFITSGGAVLRNAPKVFEEWSEVARKIARQGNAVLIAFLRATPKHFKHGPTDSASLQRVLNLTGLIAETDAESALAAFRSSTFALKRVTIDQFEAWVTCGSSRDRRRFTEIASQLFRT